MYAETTNVQSNKLDTHENFIFTNAIDDPLLEGIKIKKAKLQLISKTSVITE